VTCGSSSSDLLVSSKTATNPEMKNANRLALVEDAFMTAWDHHSLKGFFSEPLVSDPG
jgi:hypothetical protein